MTIDSTRYTLVQPLLVCDTVFKISEDVGLSVFVADEPTYKKVVKVFILYLTLNIVIPLLTPISVFYNTSCFCIKGVIAVITTLTKKEIFDHVKEEYIYDINVHLTYAIRELMNNYLIGPISLGYIIIPNTVKAINKLLIRSIGLLTSVED